MASQPAPREGKKRSFGKNPPRITLPNDGESYLVVNEPLYPESSLGICGDEPVALEEILKTRQRKSYRYHVYRYAREHCESYEECYWIYSHRIIDMKAVLEKTHETQRHLYRVFSDQSGGINACEGFQSEAVKQGQRAAMESMSELEIKENLLCHMRNSKQMPSHFISFTTSPIWAFDLALRKKAQGHKEVSIAIIDTLNLAESTKVFHAPALLSAYDVERELNFIKNRGAAEKLVWDELAAPGALIPLEKFLKTHVVEDGYIKPGYAGLQKFHFKDLGFSDHSIKFLLELFSRNPTKELHTPAVLRTKTCNSNEQKEHKKESLHSQAPKTFREKCRAGRLSQGEWNNCLEDNKRFPISDYTLHNYISLVKENFPEDLFLPILVMLLSTRLYFFEPSSIIEAMMWIPENDPLITPHGKKYEGYFRDTSSPNLPEVDASERLLRDCCEALDLPVKRLANLKERRKFLTLEVAHTKLPDFDHLSEDRAKDHLERVTQAAKRRLAEEADRQKIRAKKLARARKRAAAVKARAIQASRPKNTITLDIIINTIKSDISTQTLSRAQTDIGRRALAKQSRTLNAILAESKPIHDVEAAAKNEEQDTVMTDAPLTEPAPAAATHEISSNSPCEGSTPTTTILHSEQIQTHTRLQFNVPRQQNERAKAMNVFQVHSINPGLLC